MSYRRVPPKNTPAPATLLRVPTMKRTRGFTLIELLVTIAVVAILAAIAIPSYQDQVRKGRRAEAKSELGRLQMAMERWRADNPSFVNCSPSPCGNGTYPSVATLDYYTVTITSTTATGYTLTATPKGAQTGDECGNFAITYSNGTPTKSVTGSGRCW